MPNEKILELIKKANDAIFEAERAIADEERAYSCIPLYKMRIDLNEVRRIYKAGHTVSNHILLRDWR